MKRAQEVIGETAAPEAKRLHGVVELDGLDEFDRQLLEEYREEVERERVRVEAEAEAKVRAWTREQCAAEQKQKQALKRARREAAAAARQKEEDEAAAAIAKQRAEEDRAAAVARQKELDEAAAAIAKQKAEEDRAAAVARQREKDEAAAAIAKQKAVTFNETMAAAYRKADEAAAVARRQQEIDEATRAVQLDAPWRDSLPGTFSVPLEPSAEGPSESASPFFESPMSAIDLLVNGVDIAPALPPPPPPAPAPAQSSGRYVLVATTRAAQAARALARRENCVAPPPTTTGTVVSVQVPPNEGDAARLVALTEARAGAPYSVFAMGQIATARHLASYVRTQLTEEKRREFYTGLDVARRHLHAAETGVRLTKLLLGRHGEQLLQFDQLCPTIDGAHKLCGELNKCAGQKPAPPTRFPVPENAGVAPGAPLY
jgi:hypothetical protein